MKIIGGLKYLLCLLLGVRIINLSQTGGGNGKASMGDLGVLKPQVRAEHYNNILPKEWESESVGRMEMGLGLNQRAIELLRMERMTSENARIQLMMRLPEVGLSDLFCALVKY